MGWQVLTKGRGAALQSKTFVQTFWVQSSTFSEWALTKGQHLQKAGEHRPFFLVPTLFLMLHQEVG